MPAPQSNRLRRASGWLATATLVALAPKCALCLLAYAGVITTLGLAGPELCGAPASSAGTWATSIALSAVGLSAIAILVETRLRR